jgi:hypothetical protein
LLERIKELKNRSEIIILLEDFCMLMEGRNKARIIKLYATVKSGNVIEWKRSSIKIMKIQNL